MPEAARVINVQGNDRKTIRDNLILEFLKEQPGSVGETSIYYYYVDKTASGVDIYLKRPARLNKGMDFEVHAKNVIFENISKLGRITRISRPSHPTIIRDLREKNLENRLEYKKIAKIIEKIYNCESIQQFDLQKFNFKSGHSCDVVLTIIKWLFIEQDVTYWNWSGRERLYSAIKHQV